MTLVAQQLHVVFASSAIINPACSARNAVEKKTVLENLDLILLAMDEIVEGG